MKGKLPLSPKEQSIENSMSESLKQIFAVFVELSKQSELKYPPCERILYDFYRHEFTADDLRCVLVFILWQNSKREPRYRDKIQFHRIVGDLEVFNSRLGEARAWERNVKAKTTPKEQVLADSGRMPEEKNFTRHISEVFESIKKAIK